MSGDAWDASIRKQIKECALFVPMISASTNARSEGYFRLEWKLAVDRSHLMADDQTFFLPVVLDDTLESAARVPDKFRERQWSRIADDVAVKAFAARVAKLVDGSGSQGKSAPMAKGHADAAPVLVKNSPLVVSPLPKGFPLGANHNSASQDERDASMSFGKLRTNGVNAGDKPSIAVLAFANRSASADDEYFSDGLADELLNVLAKIKGLRVAARTSAFSFKGKQTTIEEIGKVLNVATVLEGSVRKSGNRMRISVQLVKAQDGFQLWSETYDRTLEDIFAVQDDIAQLVVTQLRSTLLGEIKSVTAGIIADVARAAKDRSDNAEAQRLYLQGRHLLARKSEQDLQRSVAYFEQAVALDPDFALAWAWLALAHCDVGSWGGGLHGGSLHDANRKARVAAEKSLSLAPGLVQALLALAQIQNDYDWDWAKAEATIQRALQIAPDNADVLTAATRLSFCLRRFDEAEAFGVRAMALDPLNAASPRILSIVLFSAGKFEAAMRAIRQAIEISPDSIAFHHVLGMLFIALRRYEEALTEAALEKAAWAKLTTLAIAHWLIGTDASRRESDAALATLLENHALHCAIQIAHVYTVRGDYDQAFH